MTLLTRKQPGSRLCLLGVSAILLILKLIAIGPASADDKATVAKDDKEAATPVDAKKADKDGWQSLFDGKNLEDSGWKVSEFGGQGEALIENGEVVISQGADMSGIYTEKEIPKSNYEVQFEAQRAAGSDFFAGLTFPVKDSFCSLIIGGWGGGVCGLSSLNGMDAVENETTTYQQFEKGKWYKVRLVVRDNHISAWLDQHQIVDVDTTDQKIGTRFEVERSKPFGFSTWQTTARLRNVRIRPLPPEDKKPE